MSPVRDDATEPSRPLLLAEALRALQRDGGESDLERVRTFTRLTDASLLERLLAAGGRSMPVLLSLLPAVLVAWADGEVDPRERRLLRATAWTLDLDHHPPGWARLERWLDAAPTDEDQALFEDFVEGVVRALPALDYESWRRDTLQTAWRVARVSGGGWLQPSVSAVEREVLAHLELLLSPSAHLVVPSLAS